MVPAAARILPTPIELDNYGISVCSVAGTDFAPYVRFLAHLDIPYVVITDGDGKDADAGIATPGIERGVGILETVGADRTAIDAAIASGEVVLALSLLRAAGIFVGVRTLEADMLAVGAGPRMAAAYQDLRPQTRGTTLTPFANTGVMGDAVEEAAIGLIERPGVGKGRFAQRFAASVAASDVPDHVAEAIMAIVARCSHVKH